MIRIIRGRRKGILTPEINITPLVDTALTLLIIFMVAAPMMNNSIRIDLPEGQAKEDGGAKQELIVFIDKNEKIYLNKDVVTPESLIKGIQKNIAHNLDKTVFVKADRSVKYGFVLQVVDHIKVVGGVRYVALATEKPRKA